MRVARSVPSFAEKIVNLVRVARMILLGPLDTLPAADVSIEGAVVYYRPSGAATGQVKVCQKTGASTYAWSDAGGGGAGGGDMTKAAYDPDGDGKVTAAVTADEALSVKLTRSLATPPADAAHEGWLIYQRGVLGSGVLLCCMQTFAGDYEWVTVAFPSA